MAELPDKDKRIAYAIIRHLQSQVDSRAVTGEAAEGVSVAQQCLSEAYGLDLGDASQRAKYEVKPTLEDLFADIPMPVNEDVKQKAEAYKLQGNTNLKLNKFQEAVDCYTNAIKLDAGNATYFCNRAAAYIKIQELQKALDDCKKAVSLNPGYARAHGRMGYVYSSLNKLEESKACFKKAIELDPENESYRANLKTVEEQLQGGGASSTAAGGGMGGATTSGTGGGGASQQQQPGGGGGNPLGGMLGNSFANIIQNPAFMNMATSLMQQPAFQDMARNMMSQGVNQPGNVAGMMPNVMQAAQDMQRNNPELFASMQQQAAQFAAGGGGGSGSGGPQPQQQGQGQGQQGPTDSSSTSDSKSSKQDKQ